MTFIAILGQIGIMSVIFLCYILARLSARLGAVTMMPPLYRWFYVSICFFFFAFVAEMLKISSMPGDPNVPSWVFSEGFVVFFCKLPVALGATISLVVCWKYWGWLLTSRDV